MSADFWTGFLWGILAYTALCVVVDAVFVWLFYRINNNGKEERK